MAQDLFWSYTVLDCIFFGNNDVGSRFHYILYILEKMKQSASCASMIKYDFLRINSFLHNIINMTTIAINFISLNMYKIARP